MWKSHVCKPYWHHFRTSYRFTWPTCSTLFWKTFALCAFRCMQSIWPIASWHCVDMIWWRPPLLKAHKPQRRQLPKRITEGEVLGFFLIKYLTLSTNSIYKYFIHFWHTQIYTQEPKQWLHNANGIRRNISALYEMCTVLLNGMTMNKCINVYLMENNKQNRQRPSNGHICDRVCRITVIAHPPIEDNEQK